MTAAEKNALSHRGRAFRALAAEAHTSLTGANTGCSRRGRSMVSMRKPFRNDREQVSAVVLWSSAPSRWHLWPVWGGSRMPLPANTQSATVGLGAQRRRRPLPPRRPRRLQAASSGPHRPRSQAGRPHRDRPAGIRWRTADRRCRPGNREPRCRRHRSRSRPPTVTHRSPTPSPAPPIKPRCRCPMARRSSWSPRTATP